MIALLLIVPVVLALLLLVVRSRIASSLFLLGYAFLHLGLSIVLVIRNGSFTRYFRADGMSVLFLLLLSAVVLCVSIYTVYYFRDVRGEHTERDYSTAVLYLLLFIDSVNGVLLSTNLGLLWVFLEASTLTSVALVNFERKGSSLEAAWKYIFICSIGISLGFIGIIFISFGSLQTASLFFDDLGRVAGSMNPFWLRLSFPFIVIGFGTKMGLAPVHSWLPDAHSEAPAPISALLSGALLNSALFGILRVLVIMKKAGEGAFAGNLLAIMGFLSLFVSVIFVLGARNYKRMLAYSSIENMGIISIGIGIGGAGIFAALLHMVGHSLSKSSFFLTAGNVDRLAHSRQIADVRGLFRRDRTTAWLWIASLLAISAMPPFVTFLSEFLLVRRLFERGALPAVLFLLLVVTIVFGMTQSVIRMVSGGDEEGDSVGQATAEVGAPRALGPQRSAHLPVLAYLPQLLLLATAAAIGLVVPGPLFALLRRAAAYLGGSP